MTRTRLVASAVLTSAILVTPALAHTGIGTTSGFVAGAVHPLFGLDHVLAMLAVGLLAGFQGGRALWAWPSSFVGVMLIGGTLGMNGVPIPAVEAMLLVSVVALGGALALGLTLPVLFGAGLVGLFALFHGHAHGVEIAAGAGSLPYATGFALSTALLHAAGIGLALATEPIAGTLLRRASGAAIVAAGVLLAVLG